MKSLLLLLLGIAIAALIFMAFPKNEQASPQATQTAHERVLESGTLRCAYGLWEPAIMRDPNTGELSGFVYELMQLAAKSLNIEVEYNIEVPWDSIHIALESDKADAHCAGVFATPARGRNLAFSTPLFFSPTVAFARADDTRFDFNLAAINAPGVTVAISDDDITTEIYNQDFPLAQTFELAQMAPPEELFLVVSHNKADVTLNTPSRLQTFERSNPGEIKVIPTERPLRIFANSIAVDINNTALLHMLNTAIYQLHNSGQIDKLIAKYAKDYDMSFMVPVNPPYTWNEQP